MAVFMGGARSFLLGFGLFALIWGAKLAVLDRFGSDLPVWDQWDAEGEALFLPWLQGRLEVSDLFQPHNEHRIAATRGLALGLLAANGQWDARLECVVNAALHAGLAVAVFLWGCALLQHRAHVIGWLITVVALTAMPVAWANVVNGFHSQQYLLLGFSLAALALLPDARPWSMRWWAGAVCAVVALFTMASGMLAPAAVVLACLLDGGPRAALRRHRVTLLLSLVIVVAGVLWHVSVPANDALRARSFGEYVAAFWRYLTWPYERLAGPRELRMAVLPWLQWLPWAWLAVRVWRGRAASDPRERVLVAAGAWVLLQFAASAYARGANAPWPPSRYIDTLVVGVLVNVLAFLRLWSSPAAAAQIRGRRLLIGGGIVAAIFLGAGMAAHVLAHFATELPQDHAARVRQTETVREYLATGDASVLAHREIPYPRADILIERLAHPEIRAILPASAQPPPGRQGWLSRAAKLATRGGVVISCLGALLVVGMLAARQEPGPPRCPV